MYLKMTLVAICFPPNRGLGDSECLELPCTKSVRSDLNRLEIDVKSRKQYKDQGDQLQPNEVE